MKQVKVMCPNCNGKGGDLIWKI